MFAEEELRAAGKHLAIVGPAISQAQIDSILPRSFVGKEDLVQSFLRCNGGSRTPKGCVMTGGNPAHRIPRNGLGKMQLEGFMSVSTDLNDRMLPFRPIIGHHATMLRMYDAVPEMKAFLKQNVPCAFDHSGNDLCIDLECGCIRFTAWEDYRKGAVEIASDFRFFILKYWINPEPTLESNF